MKKIINRAETLVLEMCNGIVLANPELELLPKYKVIKRRELRKEKVSLISGGGSGHEPAHAGYVGKGMLDAAVCGDVFASPTQIQVYQAIRASAGEKGTLLIIKNYSGDMMNFQNAAFLAQSEGLAVDYVRVDDDIAVEDSLYTVGRRGVAGTVLVHKVAGAAAEEGRDLAGVKALAEKAVANVRSLGFALSSCTVPAKASPTFTLPEDEMEFGVGIHGEPGIRREKVLDADALAKRMVEALCHDLKLESGNRAALLVNGFGATSLMELYLFNHALVRELSTRGITIHREFVGNYMTSIDMAGASVSLMKLDDELAALLDAPSEAPAFRVGSAVKETRFIDVIEEETARMEKEIEIQPDALKATIEANQLSFENMQYIVSMMGKIIIDNEIPFCELDAHAGDGDFGSSVAKGFRQVMREWNDILKESDTIFDFLTACSLIIMEHCGGASGPIWGFAFKAAANSVKGKEKLSVADFAQLLKAAVEGIQLVGARSFGRGAVLGDKTLIDALIPCADAWVAAAQNGESMKKAFEDGARAAVDGAKKTELIAAKMGRAGTVGERSIGFPDAGAYALGVIFEGIADGLRNA